MCKSLEATFGSFVVFWKEAYSVRCQTWVLPPGLFLEPENEGGLSPKQALKSVIPHMQCEGDSVLERWLPYLPLSLCFFRPS